MRFEVPEAKKLVHEMTIPLRWGDMDAMQHVNNTSYLRYFETVRIEWMNSIGAMPNPHGEGPVIVNVFCNFLRQLEFPGAVIAKHFIAAVGTSSFETYFTLEREDVRGVICSNGGATVVWVKDQRPMALPSWLRALL